jgi:AraC-like DNA-binding protein
MPSNFLKRRGRCLAQQRPQSAPPQRTRARTKHADLEGETADLGPPPLHDPRIGRALHAIETRFAEPNLSLAKLAREQNLSTWHLCRLLSKHAETSFRQRLHDSRCAHALRLLAGTALSIKEIAAAVGYNETRGLDRQFRKRYGCTPSDTRRHLPRHLPPKADE